MGTDMVRLEVGETRHVFQVHEKLLQQNLPYFEDAFTALATGPTGYVRPTYQIPLWTVPVFDLLLQWLYGMKLRIQAPLLNFTLLYFLADDLRCDALIDEMTTVYIDESNWRKNILLAPEFLRTLFLDLQPRPHIGLRDFVVYCFRYILHGMPREHAYFRRNPLHEVSRVLESTPGLITEYVKAVHQLPLGQLAPDPRRMPRYTFHQHAESLLI